VATALPETALRGSACALRPVSGLTSEGLSLAFKTTAFPCLGTVAVWPLLSRSPLRGQRRNGGLSARAPRTDFPFHPGAV